MTGAELRAWRERLGKDEAWAAEVLRHVRHGEYRYEGSMSDGMSRLRSVEGSCLYPLDVQAAFVSAYSAALDAEERAQAEPVCPEGVACWSGLGGEARVGIANNGASVAVIMVRADGSMTTTPPSPLTATAALLRYAADLSEYRARQHAEGDRQRKLDAVKAAEEANEAAKTAFDEASANYTKTARALEAARREAGL